MAVAAFFDIDGTLIARNSASLYMRHLRRTGQARRRDLARTLYYVWRYKLGLLDIERAKLRREEIDLWELNEAFAAQSLGVLRELRIPKNRVNVHGGAIALGHPIGASGARVLVTLLHAMADRDARLGVASLCIGGGQGIALVAERA